MTTTAPDHDKESRWTRLGEPSFVAGVFSPDHLRHLDPAACPPTPPCWTTRTTSSAPAPTPACCSAASSSPAHRPRRHRHRRRAVPGAQAAERSARARLRHHPPGRSRHHRHRRRQPPVGRDPATGPRRDRRRTTRPRSSPSAQSLVAVHDWTFLLGPGLMAGIERRCCWATLMYRSGLVPRVIPMLGLIAGPAALRCPGSACFFGVFEPGSAPQVIATAPDLRLGAVARHLPDGQGLQALAHHRGNDRRLSARHPPIRRLTSQ